MGNEKEKTNKNKQWMATRDVLWYLVFFGFAVNYMIRINLNIAIVSMVQARPKSNVSSSVECFTELSVNESLINGTESAMQVQEPADETKFEWNEKQQGLILGAFFWLHWATQVPGGILAAKYGTKMVFGVSNFVGVLLCFLMPWASYLGPEYLIFLRVVQGIITGFAWPAMHHMTARWIPPNERSKFVTAYLGSSVGAGITFPVCGYIISRWGWEVVFHVCGVAGCVWYTAWYFLVFDSPADHPRISAEEREYIVRSLGRSISKEKAPVPWRAILSSWPVWLNILAQWGGIWGLFTAMTHAPTYFKVIHGWNIKATGLLSGMPHFIRMAWAYVFSRIGDYLLSTNKMTRTNVRKLATFFACIVHGFCMLALAYSGCNSMAAIVFLTAATAIHGAVSTGSLASFVDLSPNYASVQLGLSGMISVLPGFISPAIVGVLTYNNQTASQWQKVFWLSAFMLIVPGILYLFFAKSELQDWNSPTTGRDSVLESEMKTLKNGKLVLEDDEEDEDQEDAMHNTEEKVKEEAEKVEV